MMNKNKVEEFLRNVHILTVAVNRILEDRYLKETSPVPISFSRYNLLKLIQHKGVQFVGDVARFLGVSSPAASRTVENLVRQGLLFRNEDPNDRRVARLTITEKGETIIQAYEGYKQAKIGEFLEHLPAQDRISFNENMERFYTHLASQEHVLEELCLQCGAYVPSECCIETMGVSCVYKNKRVRGEHTQSAPQGA